MEKTELTEWQKDSLPMILERAKKAKDLRKEIAALDHQIGPEILSLTAAIQCYANEVAEGLVNGYEASMTVKELADLVQCADLIRAKLTPQIPDWAKEYVDEGIKKEQKDDNA
jgi:predicted alpha/beta hydrolase